MYLRLTSQGVVIYPYNLDNLRSDYPNISFPYPLATSALVDLGIMPIQPIDPPEYNTLTQDCVEQTPILIDNYWVQQWQVVNIPTEEATLRLNSWRSNLVVSSRQANLALLTAGLLDAVEAWVATRSRQDQIEWHKATEFRRNWPLIEQAGPALGLTPIQIDNLFVLASTFV